MKWKRLILVWVVLLLATLVSATEAAPKKGRRSRPAKSVAQRTAEWERAARNWQAQSKSLEMRAKRGREILNGTYKDPNKRADLSELGKAVLPAATSNATQKPAYLSLFDSPDVTAVIVVLVFAAAIGGAGLLKKVRPEGPSNESNGLLSLNPQLHQVHVSAGTLGLEYEPEPKPRPTGPARVVKNVQPVVPNPVYIPVPLPAPAKPRRTRATAPKPVRPARCLPFKPDGAPAQVLSKPSRTQNKPVAEAETPVASTAEPQVAWVPPPAPITWDKGPIEEPEAVQESPQATWVPDTPLEPAEHPLQAEMPESTLQVENSPDAVSLKDEEPEFPALETVPEDFKMPGLLVDDGIDYMASFRSEDLAASTAAQVTH